MKNLLRGKIILVTGGAGLLGKEFVKAIVSCGGVGILADINELAGKQVARSINQALKTNRATFVKLDITSKNSILDVIKVLLTKYGKFDALVNNAYPRNKHYGAKFEDVSYDDFCENINLNLGGTFLISQQLAMTFKKQGYGNIINIASIYGLIAPRFEIYQNTSMTMPVEYAVIKSALIHLTKYMAKYYKGANIRINSISPGGIADNQPDSFIKKYNSHCLNKGMLDRSDINGTLVYLLSDQSERVNGQNIVVDDGLCL